MFYLCSYSLYALINKYGMIDALAILPPDEVKAGKHYSNIYTL